MKTVRTGLIMAAIFTAIILAGCGDNQSKNNTTTAEDTTPQAETTTASTVSASQLHFFTERYISTDERLLRRQNRIEEELSESPTAGQN